MLKHVHNVTKLTVVAVFMLGTICLEVKGAAPPLVKTELGDIKGYYITTTEGRNISAFTGIPYALPPVDQLRFKAPVPIKKWNKVLEATSPTPICVQRNPYIRQKEIVGQEDCLYMNIYTPYNRNELMRNKRSLPVMVWIHGGGWMCGDSTTFMYGPEILLNKDIVLVTINYRLGPLGFLSTQDEHCPGNNGLKDQQEALRFVQKIVHNFGGNKNSVTIFGESAGGASVHYHMLSKTSAGLFHKAISESGTAYVPWAEAPPGEARRNAFRLAKLMKCPQSPSVQMINCLRSKDSYEIIETEHSFYNWDYEPMTPFKAVIEPDMPGAFLTKSPRKVTDVKTVPWMTGLTSDEGCLKSVWITSDTSRFEEFVSGFDAIAPVTFYYDGSQYTDEITKAIKDKYFGDNSVEAIKAGLPKIYTDSYFAYPAIEAIESVLNHTKNPVYLYELTYRATNSFSQIFGDPAGNYGVCHADDLMHLFPIHFLEKPFSEQDKEISKLIVTLWTNFATTGNPNRPVETSLKWEAATSGSQMEYLEINVKPSMKRDLASRARFWASMPLWHSARKTRFIDEL